MASLNWRLRDPYGHEWRLSLVRPGEPTEAPTPTFEARSALDVLVFAAFDHSGARDDALSAALLEVYDALTGAGVARTLPWPGRPTEDPEQRLRGIAGDVRAQLRSALLGGELGVDLAEAPPWPFVEEEEPEVAAAPAESRPEVTTWIAIKLVDPDGNPVPRRGIHLTLADKSDREGFFDGAGTFRLDGIAAGDCKVTFPDLDVTDFAAPTVRVGKEEDEEIGPVVADASGGGVTYTAEPGDTVSSIADRYGFLHFATIWSHASNDTLRDGRSDPHVLLAGDEIVVPAKKPRAMTMGTGREHTLTVYVQALKVKLKTLDYEGKSVALDETSFATDGAEAAVDGGGNATTVPIPRSTRQVQFKSAADAEASFAVEIGAMPPLREAGGAQARLENLGYGVFGDDAKLEDDDPDAEDPDIDEHLELAIELFQDAIGQDPSGETTDDVLNQLRDLAGA